MLDPKNPESRRMTAFLFRKIADRLEQDEAFAVWLFEGGDYPEETKPVRRGGGSTKNEKADAAALLPDIYLLYLAEGKEALHDALRQYELETLRALLLHHHLDPTRKVRRWKTKEKVVAFIAEAVVKQMDKGKVFLTP